MTAPRKLSSRARLSPSKPTTDVEPSINFHSRPLIYVGTERGTLPLVSLMLVSGPDDDGSPRFTVLLPGRGLSDAAQTL
jgi:hypothetical protein